MKMTGCLSLSELWPLALIHVNVCSKSSLIKFFFIFPLRAFNNTHSLFICSTCSMLTMPAMLKFSLYWLILIDSSHSDTDLKGDPSEPLVLGSRIETLREIAEHIRIWSFAFEHLCIYYRRQALKEKTCLFGHKI